MDQFTISPNSTNDHPQNGAARHRRTQQEDPFPLIAESQTPLTDISSSDFDNPSTKPRAISNGSTYRARAKKARKAAHTTQPTVPALRPAKDILSRIRHDPGLGGEREYVVGYVDRHEREPLEMDVTEWKGGVSDVTDEEFIPQHRILYFRRKGDGEGRKVWDRASRLDRVFGSGVAEEEEEEEEEEQKKAAEVEEGGERSAQLLRTGEKIGTLERNV